MVFACVQVAQGGQAHEPIPMLLKVPRFEHPELGGYSMLGFGDVVLPGAGGSLGGGWGELWRGSLTNWNAPSDG